MSSEISDWDVDSHKTDQEPDGHWDLRRRFMLLHKDTIPEEELVCLSQVFANIEFLGCRYPSETMTRVAELAKGVVEKFRESRKDKLKRTFVSASDAAILKFRSQKRKGEGAKNKNVVVPTIDLTKEEKSENPTDALNSSALLPNPYYSPSSRNNETMNKKNKKKPKRKKSRTKKLKNQKGIQPSEVVPNENNNDVITLSNSPDVTTSSTHVTSNEAEGPLSKFVLFMKTSEDDHPISIIQRNASLNNGKIKWRYIKADEPKTRKCCLFFNNYLLASESGIDMKGAREIVAQAAINKLQECCYTVKEKAKEFSSIKVDKSALGMEPTTPVEAPKTEEPPKSNLEKELGSNNVGLRIMKLMGWTGGGLGINQQGIEEPIKTSTTVHRKGLGLPVKEVKATRKKKGEKKNSPKKQVSKKITKKKSKASFKEKATAYIQKWLESKSDQDLVFSSEFDNVERKAMHQIAQRLSLKSESYGNAENRYLVLSKKPSPWETVEELIAAGGSSDKYELVYPCKT